MATNGVVGSNEMQFGVEYPVQTLTISWTSGNEPTSGSLAFRYIRNVTSSAPASLPLSASGIQTAIRTLPGFSAATVVDAGSTSLSHTFTITPLCGSHAVVQLLEPVAHFLNGTGPAAVITGQAWPLVYDLARPVGPSSVQALAAKLFIPGTSSERASQTRATQIVFEDLFGGLGRLNNKEAEVVDRYWDASCWAFLRRQITLPGKKNAVTFSGFTSTPKTILNGIEYAGVPWAVFDCWNSGASDVRNEIAWFNSSTNVWTSVYAFATAAASTRHPDILCYKNHLIVCNGTTTVVRIVTTAGPTYTPTAVTGVGSAGVVSAAIWDDKLVRVDADGAFYWTTVALFNNGADWTATAITFAEESVNSSGPQNILALKVWRDEGNLASLHLIHSRGIYYVNIDTNVMRRRVVLPGFTPINSSSPTTPAAAGPNSVALYQTDLCVISQGNVLRYNGQSLDPIGPLTDEGLPVSSVSIGQGLANYSNPTALFSINTWLFCSMEVIQDAGGLPLTIPFAIVGTASRAYGGMLLGFNGSGWHIASPWETASGVTVAQAFGRPVWAGARLFFGDGSFRRWYDSSQSPLLWPTQSYETSGDLVTPWVDRGLAEVDKVAYSLELGARNLSTTETITVYYQIDSVPDSTVTTANSDPHSGWKQMLLADGSVAVVNSAAMAGSSGRLELFHDRSTLPDGATKYSTGVRFTSIRYWFHLAASSGTPVLEYAAVNMDAQFSPLMAFEVSALLSGNKGGRSVIRQWNDIQEVYRAVPLIPFAWGDSDVYYVKVDVLRGNGLGSGATPGDPLAGRPIVALTLSERLRTA